MPHPNRAYERAGRLGDGWFPMLEPGRLDHALEQVNRAAESAGRDPKNLGMEGRVSWTEDRDKLAATIAAWKAAGASHLSVNTMKAGFANVDEHLGALERVAEDMK